MRFNGIEHYDHFSDCTIFWAEISDVPPDIQSAAAIIDGADYLPDGFGLCVSHEKASGELEIMTERGQAGDKPLNIFYIDNDGNYRWFHADMPRDFIQQVLMACKNILTERGDNMPSYESIPISRQLQAAKQLARMHTQNQQESVKDTPDKGDR